MGLLEKDRGVSEIASNSTLKLVSLVSLEAEELAYAEMPLCI